MGNAKKLIVKPIKGKDASRVIRALHYSKTAAINAQINLGVFLNDKCGGALQFGPSLDKRRMKELVSNTGWNEFLELNRMAFADWLPRNGESRCISYSMRWIKKLYPWIKWIVSFADGTQCGDGTIYRASGFKLIGIKKNKTIVTRRDGSIGSEFTGGKHVGGIPLDGYQLKYIFFIDPLVEKNLTVPILPFSEIDARGARMYRGEKCAGSITVDASGFQPEEGGSTPTPALQK